MYISAAAVSHVGAVREANQDNYFFNGKIFGGDKDNGKVKKLTAKKDKPILIGVFDGMGGISSGDRASLIAALTARELSREASLDPDTMMKKICSNANAAICSEMRANGQRMGTTAVMLVFSGGKFYMCNIGDSPAYIFRGKKMLRLSAFHNERAAYETRTGKKARRSQKFKLTQYLGIFPEEMVIAPYSMSSKLRPGDQFLLCSDGLTDALKLRQIKEIVLSGDSVNKKSQQLIQAALDNNCGDNVTVICAEILKDKPSIFG